MHGPFPTEFEKQSLSGLARGRMSKNQQEMTVVAQT